MAELPSLVSCLALILACAGVFAMLFKWLKQPVVLGYIVAGIVASFFITKHTPDYNNIETWAEIGVIFLLFGLGLEFSFKKLMKVGSTAFIAAIFLVVSMIGLGYLTGVCFGWNPMKSMFLGAMICMSSTMIIVKVFDDLKMTNRNFAGIVLGILIIEDLVAVLLMVLLSTIAVSNSFEGTQLLGCIFKLCAFLMFWFVLGTFLIPTFLRKTKRFLNDETILIISLAFCLGMVFLATKAGFSAALGAFIMGSILSETIDSERIEHLIQPIKNLFGAIFFVSVGMMVQVTSLGAYIIPILIISATVIAGQSIFATVGVLLSGQNLRTSIAAGFSLSQLGEFSYIIGTLGLSLGVIEESLYQIIVSASVITIFTTPYMIKFSEPATRWLERKLPQRWQNHLNKNASGAHPVNQNSLWKKLLKDMAYTVVLYYFICIVTVYFSLKYAAPFILGYLPGIKGELISAAVILLVISPFIRTIIIKKNRSYEFLKLWKENKNNRGPLIFTVIFRIMLCTGLIMFLLFKIFHTNFVIALSLAIILLIMFTASRHLKLRTQLIESRFKENFNEKEKYRESKAPVTKGFTHHVMERDLHLSEFIIKPYFSIVGKTLKELNFRQYFGVNVVTIIRGEQRINIPDGQERIYPHDHMVVLGTDEQMELFRTRLEEKLRKYENEETKTTVEVRISQIQISPNSHLVGKTILTSNIQKHYSCLVAGIERDDCSIQNPDLNLEFEEGDIIWLIGENSNIYKINEI
ncbi:MAG: cation:proton antiporter [Dysgonamonadaceae bacterium]|jgi:CPA2 family monovalent cation:H+ antiporter-2|nr:cation:proton antiporter [Dysgonamonadaceae bacterium]